MRRVHWRWTRLGRFGNTRRWSRYLALHCLRCDRVAFASRCIVGGPFRSRPICPAIAAPPSAQTSCLAIARPVLRHHLLCLANLSVTMGMFARPPRVCSDRCGRYTDRPWNDCPRTCSGSHAPSPKLECTFTDCSGRSCRGCNHMRGLVRSQRLNTAHVCAKQHSGSRV